MRYMLKAAILLSCALLGSCDRRPGAERGKDGADSRQPDAAQSAPSASDNPSDHAIKLRFRVDSRNPAYRFIGDDPSVAKPECPYYTGKGSIHCEKISDDIDRVIDARIVRFEYATYQYAGGYGCGNLPCLGDFPNRDWLTPEYSQILDQAIGSKFNYFRKIEVDGSAYAIILYKAGDDWESYCFYPRNMGDSIRSIQEKCERVAAGE